jgi:hypothetical protein
MGSSAGVRYNRAAKPGCHDQSCRPEAYQRLRLPPLFGISSRIHTDAQAKKSPHKKKPFLAGIVLYLI